MRYKGSLTFVLSVILVQMVLAICFTEAGHRISLATAQQPAPTKPTGQPVFNVVDFGAIGDGNPANAGVNTIAFQAAINAGGPVYVPITPNGFAVNNGVLKVSSANVVIKGEAGMGSVPSWGPTSTIIGIGAGDTLQVNQGGCRISGLAWKNNGKQTGADAYIKIIETQVSVFDHYMHEPNIGISIQHKPNNFIGQTWMRNILMGGYFKPGGAGIDLNNGGGAALIEHVRMFNGVMIQEDPQPAYGILVKSAGELFMSRCDICNCGVNLAIVPGIDGQANSFVQNLDITNCDFDNGSGEAQILIRPYGSSFVLDVQITNGWTSTAQTSKTTWHGNGITVDGTRSHTAMGFPSICNVGLVNCIFQYAVGHAGVYANQVHALSIERCTAAGNFTGFQVHNSIGLIDAVCAGNYKPPYQGQPTPGNTGYGIYLQGGNMKFNRDNNALDGNGAGPYTIVR